MKPELRISKSEDALARIASDFIYDDVLQKLKRSGSASVVLAGGRTPERSYSLLAERLSVRKPDGFGARANITWLLGDERWVKPDDSESNERMVRCSLFQKPAQTPGTLVSWNACRTSQFKTALEYGEQVESIFEGKAGPDLLLLGLGNDGHTASLFPGSSYLCEDGELEPIRPDLPVNALAVYLHEQKTWRLSLTPCFLNRSDTVLFLVSGAAKKNSLSLLLARDPSIPASWIEGRRMLVFATEDAVAQ